MRTIPLLALLALAAAPAAAQGIVIPLRCEGACPADGLPHSLAIDSVDAWGTVRRGFAHVYVDHVFRNGTAGTVDGAFFFPLPAGATIQDVSIHGAGGLEQYVAWSEPGEARRLLERIVRERPESGLREYAGVGLVHVAVGSIPAGGERRVRIVYHQVLPDEDGTRAFRYPLSVGAIASPIGVLRLELTIHTDAGFDDVYSPSHPVDVRLGMEGVPCREPMRCGSRGAASFRVKVVRLVNGPGDRMRDLEIRYTPKESAGERRSAFVP
jgi:hypothetical protein